MLGALYQLHRSEELWTASSGQRVQRVNISAKVCIGNVLGMQRHPKVYAVHRTMRFTKFEHSFDSKSARAQLT